MGLDGVPNRIAHYFKTASDQPDGTTHIIGLHLSKSQAYTLGLEAKPQAYEIKGTGYGDCLTKAANLIDEKFVGFTI